MYEVALERGGCRGGGGGGRRERDREPPVQGAEDERSTEVGGGGGMVGTRTGEGNAPISSAEVESKRFI